VKPASECQTLADVRVEIDRIDEQIVTLLGMRAAYVHAAARFKSSEAAVAAPERLEAMLKTRREWAAREGLSPDFVEKLYREIVAWFIARETEEWKNVVSGKPDRD